MASLFFTFTQACQSAQGTFTLDSVTDAPGAPAGGVYRWAIVQVSTGTDYGTDPASVGTVVASLPDGGYTLRLYGTYPDGSTATSSPQTATISCASSSGGGGGGGGTAPVYGCMLANAFNYNDSATQDTNPSACVFVLVESAPAQLVAAHLPIPVVVRAAPTLAGVPAIVRLLLQTAPTPTTADADWVEFGQLVAVCDADYQAARFNLSEAASSLLRISPPVESGTDAGLSALLRVRYEVLDPITRAVATSGLVGTARVLNAVVQPLSGVSLTTATPYPDTDTIPTGTHLWSSSATFAAGVVSAAVTREQAPCPGARQFVWLNARGVWDSGFFTGRHQHGTDVADPVGYRDAAGVDRWASRGQVRHTLAVYSDKLDFPTYQALRGIRTSIQVYERLPGSGAYVPVRVNGESYSEYQEVTDKTYQVNFTVSYPAQLIQTQ